MSMIEQRIMAGKQPRPGRPPNPARERVLCERTRIALLEWVIKSLPEIKPASTPRQLRDCVQAMALLEQIMPPSSSQQAKLPSEEEAGQTAYERIAAVLSLNETHET